MVDEEKNEIDTIKESLLEPTKSQISEIKTRKIKKKNMLIN